VADFESLSWCSGFHFVTLGNLNCHVQLSPSFIAIAGAAVALILIKPDMEEILKEIEWGILLFFSALFIVVGGLEASGILNILAEKITNLALTDVLLAGKTSIWVGAVISAIVDNITYTIIMIPTYSGFRCSWGGYCFLMVGTCIGGRLWRKWDSNRINFKYHYN